MTIVFAILSPSRFLFAVKIKAAAMFPKIGEKTFLTIDSKIEQLLPVDLLMTGMPKMRLPII